MAEVNGTLQNFFSQHHHGPLGPHIIKPLIQNKPKWKYQMPFHLLFLSKYKPKALSMVQITRFDMKALGMSGIRKLGKVLKETKRIYPLIINLDEPDIKELGKLLSWTNNWKELEFYSDNTWPTKLEKPDVLSLLKNYKDLSCLSIYFGHCFRLEDQKTITECCSRQSKYLRRLKTVNLDFNYIKPTPGFQILGRNIIDETPIFTIKYLKSLSSLYLSYHETTAITKELLCLLTANIQSNNSLQHLELNLDAISASVATPDSEIWEKFFEKTQGLKTLSLTKHLFETETLRGAQVFSQGLHHLKNLTALKLNFLFYLGETQSQSFTSALYCHLASLPSLKSLNLDFKIVTGSRYASPPNIFPCSLLSQLPHLERFRFKFDFCYELNDSLLQGFFRSLQNLENLRSLELFLTVFEISSQAWEILSQSLRKLEKLQVLNLYFPFAKQNSHALLVFSESIARFIHLKSLSLIFSRFMEGGPKSFLEKIGDTFKKDQKEIRCLFSSLSGFGLLSTLNLDLSIVGLSLIDCENFSIALKELTQLKDLCLVLPKLDSANDFESLQHILSSLKELPRLASLFLTLRQAVQDGELDILAENLSDCRSLEHVELRFKYVEAVTKEAVKNIVLKLARLLFLKDLKIYLGGLLEQLRLEEMSRCMKNLDMFQVGNMVEGHNPTNPLLMLLQTPWK